MTTLRLAVRNLLGAGTRTWLNVVVLSFSFVTIIYVQGLLEGTWRQAQDAVIRSECAGGQYWQAAYDPFDPLTLTEAHAPVPEALAEMARQGRAVPVLITQGSIYPQGRVRPVLLKGIDPDQKILDMPTKSLAGADGAVPAFVGPLMARSTGLKTGDYVTVEWRDAHGTFDARQIHITQVMNTIVPGIDNGQLWLPLPQLQQMNAMNGEATIVTVARDTKSLPAIPGWTFRSPDYLLRDMRALIQSKSAGSSVLYLVLMLLAMLAIFDTQVLSIFRRRREMGTLMALGMTRGGVIRLFTVEGALHGVLAAVVAALYGIPLFVWMARTGLAMPTATQSMGFTVGARIFPAYGVGLVMGTTILVLVVTTIVSYLPTRRIAKLKPTDALRGRWS
jgi:ABC-type lipoprotein release transport system permease subunit